ncbi:Aste57867_8252 [Aphanomyces stellatus]|uniref:Aste57867_8252 protein n=1 Tax=Aphanomyces stellatus TaxID=120398 RepID=A0A485KJQ5_9STRA|nr:hypothetical protein As57867_008221 [Aphanomyces stellatus]VFT85139.1 Aste57867_8252 [Aphanomyces stellatus]
MMLCRAVLAFVILVTALASPQVDLSTSRGFHAYDTHEVIVGHLFPHPTSACQQCANANNADNDSSCLVASHSAPGVFCHTFHSPRGDQDACCCASEPAAPSSSQIARPSVAATHPVATRAFAPRIESRTEHGSSLSSSP